MTKDGYCQNIQFDPIDISINNLGNSTNMSDQKLKHFEYIIKSDSVIHPNFDYASIGDTKLWSNISDPSQFDINRWINVKNDSKSTQHLQFHNNINSMPFGIGVRQCLGQTMATKELYIFLANLLINYHFVLDDDQNVQIKYQTGHTKKVAPQVPVKVINRKS